MLQKHFLTLKKASLFSLIALSTFLVPAVSNAITPSPAMIEQLKKLPKSEQARLMKQYGLSPDMLNGLSNQQDKPLENPELISPREDLTEFELQMLAEQRELDEGEDKEPELKPYGYDMFAGQPTTFAPVSDIPVPAEYLMGPGDVINIQIYGKENQSYSLTVARNGSIQVPDMGPVSVMGLTFANLQQQLSEKINEQHIGVQSSISLGELRSIRIIIAGEAYKPGSYTVSSLSTITQALFTSGGVSDIASLRNIQLKRAGKTVTTFDLYDLLMKGDASNDARLQSGDVIFIPPVGAMATVKGEVRRAAIYELKGKQTVEELVKLAAGLKAKSFPKASVLESHSSSFLPTLVNVDLTTAVGKQYVVNDGDVLTVQSTSNKIKNQITLAGAVTRPGFYQWRKGMRVSDLIQSQWSDLKGTVDLNYALVVREVNLQGDIETLQFSLAHVFADKSAKDNLVLNARDTLVVFNQREDILEVEDNLAENELEDPLEEELDLTNLYLDKNLIVDSYSYTRRQLLTPILDKLKSQNLYNGVTNLATVSGEVRFTGEYPISSNSRITDLITAAGGLKESAYVNKAELTSYVTDSTQEASVRHTNVELDKILNGNEIANLNVVSKDHLNILKIPSWQENISVTLKGEVRFPGEYSVRQGETLESVIKRAGGYTQQAFLTGAVFTRESVKEQELAQILKLADQLRLNIAAKGLSGEGSSVPFSEASLMLKELENLKAVGRMVIELEHQDESKNNNDLAVENGDMLFIPSQQQIVTVVGEVQHASTHFYNDGLDVNQYLKLAGGIKQRADDERIYIIRANGSVMIPESNYWFNGEQQIKPGDTIVVPLDTEYKDNLTLWSQVTGIIYNAAVALAAVKGL